MARSEKARTERQAGTRWVVTGQIRAFLSDRRGGEAVEWPLVVALVILIAIGAWSQFQDALGAVLTALVAAIGAVVN